MSKNTTCNSREYNACTKMCCNGVIQNKVKNDVEMACCGINSYDGKKQVCCGGQLHPRYICKYGYRWWRYDRFTYENKCSSNRYVRLTYTNKPCPIPVQRKRVFRPLTTPTPTTETAATTETIQPESKYDYFCSCFFFKTSNDIIDYFSILNLLTGQQVSVLLTINLHPEGKGGGEGVGG